MNKPHIVALGGTSRPESATGRALARCLAIAEEAGARTTLLTGEAINFPPYELCDPVPEGNVAHFVDVLRSADAVRRCRPAPTIPNLVYVWASDAAANVLARFFFLKHGAVIEDPGTGSACANLGGWHVLTKQPLPISLTVSQGEAVRRPSTLYLDVAKGAIRVGGFVHELGRGVVEL